ncbi:MAG: acetyl-CoA carboxylase carboxyltransferase subunit alpha/beta [Chloroflexi bacterium]|nr:acetyl-CoA carboxylase carboxyltransferase subunit alpha/beta [Chloroflexota bacterium]
MTNITPLFPDEGGSDSQDGAGDHAHELNLKDRRASCLMCGGKLRDSETYARYLVCPHCNFHYNMSARERVAAVADSGSFQETNRWVQSIDPLSFSPRVSYRVRLLADQQRTGLEEAAVTGTCAIGGTEAILIVLDFGFLGGSMGVVVGEKVALALELAARKKLPAVAVITSGGARIQEGVLSLMQMAKTTVAVNNLHDKGMPLIAVLGNPSTGQVYASFASLADIILAEPGAHIGFAPFRAIQKTADRQAAADEYTAENYQKFGLIDGVADRREVKHILSTFLDLLNPDFKLSGTRRTRQANTPIQHLEPWEMVQTARHPDRPKASDYIDRMFVHFVELHGDRVGADDRTVIIGMGRLAGTSCIVIAQEKQPDPPDNELGERTGIGPEGFRKAQRAVEFAGRFKLPIISLIDTPGADINLEAEKRGLGGAIAGMISAMARVPVGSISVLIGEGGSEAALAFGVADRVLMLQNAIYSPIAPEAGAEAELRDSTRAAEMAKALKLTSVDCQKMGIVDIVVPEPEGGAHRSPDEAARLLRRALMQELINVSGVYSRTLVRRRQRKYRNVGEFGSRFRNAVRREMRTVQAAVSATVRAMRKPSDEEEKAAGKTRSSRRKTRRSRRRKK